ncbi:magnesium-translocating P-type ATPase [Flavihumibacter fluvii]|uniref:magnesium-translocating P-type ATPase n=1 Tax=Flavihumibacter fluvii TaxID=2838157 RepID=UPI001BDF0607|nr:magnesium-translocating P-type ATPase [Flavihumibacter fluvii]ULQ50805.1 magnesium-translocating P-type ATPase [Flavihumibacter fluvii]
MEKNISSEIIEQLFVQLKSGPAGLTTEQANDRFALQAKMEKLPGRYNRELKLFIRQFTNPLVLLLLIAVILSAVLGEVSDVIIIFFILVLTGIMGFLQELNAGRAVEKLRKLIEVKHMVLRDLQELELSTREIVPGDVIVFNAGDMIPADCRIIESNELHVNESTLTGESFPVEKKAGIVPEDTPLSKKHNCLWQGANIVSGTAKAVVVYSGSNTVFGSLTHSLEKEEETAFEKGIKSFGYFLLRITVILSLVILVSNLFFKKPIFDAILFSLALAIGMAPELLPAIMTFAMAAGAKRMLKKKVIVKTLSSIFNFGEVNVLCTDKTGTITEGSVGIKDVVDINGNANERIKRYTFLNAHFQQGFSNSIDQAILALNMDCNGYDKLDEIPYDFIRKRLTILVSEQGQPILITKGALPNVLEVCTFYEDADGFIQKLGNTTAEAIRDRFSGYAEEGLRVLGIACKSTMLRDISHADESDMVFMGFILLQDPIKESAVSSIAKLKELKVEVKIITGDNRYAAAHIARIIGIKSDLILTGDELNRISPEALLLRVRDAAIFAEIEPHQKERIIYALQKSKYTVAYIGDGINDVAAIHAADCGISTSNAVDIAKEAADFVLLEKDLGVLADGVIEGRKSFMNSMKYIFITTGATFGNMFSIAAASVFLPFLPMLPKQILLNNFISDLPFLTIASDNVDQEELKVPGKWNIKLIQHFMVVFGLHSSVFDFLTFWVLYSYFKLSGSAFQTGWFIESVITELVILFIVRTKKPFFKSRPGKMLLWSCIFACVITIYLPFSPFADLLGLKIEHAAQALAIAGILVLYVITGDILKLLFFKYSKFSNEPKKWQKAGI